MKPRYLRLILIWTVVCSCNEPSGIYVDLKKQAIRSCNGEGLKEIRIENDSTEITLEGTEATIYFNKINPVARITTYGDVDYNYTLKLQSKCNYVKGRIKSPVINPDEIALWNLGIITFM